MFLRRFPAHRRPRAQLRAEAPAQIQIRAQAQP